MELVELLQPLLVQPVLVAPGPIAPVAPVGHGATLTNRPRRKPRISATSNLRSRWGVAARLPP